MVWRTTVDANGVVGESPQMKAVQRAIREASHVCWPVLLLGEIGTETRSLARCIHERGATRGKPFLAVDCRLASHVVEDELRRAEWPEGTKGGTLFLDEVFELAPNPQKQVID
jgi:DNA-binding NtrC family response regulator